MKQLMIKPSIYKYDTAKAFAEEFAIGEGDLVISNSYIYTPFFGDLNLKCDVLFQENYGVGEPSDDMAEGMYRDIKGSYKRIIAIGGGTVIDISKIFALKKPSPVLDLFDGVTPLEKDKELVLVPTTCGTGSEVTNISVLALNSRNTKKGLADDALFADSAVMLPCLLTSLPPQVFGASSIDALIHAVESALSPKASTLTKLFSYKAIEMILTSYQVMAEKGPDSRNDLLGEFLQASTYAGIAFGNAGCATVHAMSYPLGGVYHVPHGESNYAMFTGVLKKYMEYKQDGEIAVFNTFLSKLLHCSEDVAYQELETLLNVILPKKALREYNMTEKDIDEFTDSVMENQTRLLANSFVDLTKDDIRAIYKSLY